MPFFQHRGFYVWKLEKWPFEEEVFYLLNNIVVGFEKSRIWRCFKKVNMPWWENAKCSKKEKKEKKVINQNFGKDRNNFLLVLTFQEYFVALVSLHFWNQNKIRHFIIPNKTCFKKKYIYSLKRAKFSLFHNKN